MFFSLVFERENERERFCLQCLRERMFFILMFEKEYVLQCLGERIDFCF